MRIMVVDDHAVVRLGLITLLQQHGYEVVGEADNAEDAVKLALELIPDLVIMDVRLPEDQGGIEACREICAKNPEVNVLMLTSYGDDEAIFASVLAGAKGYLLKHIDNQGLIDAINRAGRGESILDTFVAQRVIARAKEIASAEVRPASNLNPQEERILDLIAEGKTNKEIAVVLNLSDKTVKNYVSVILSKLNLSNRAEAAAYTIRNRN